MNTSTKIAAALLAVLMLASCGNTFSAVNFHSYNAANFADYDDGLVPTCPIAEDFTGTAKEATELLEKTYGDRVMKTRIRKTIRLAEAPVQGSSVLTYESNGKAAAQYRELAQEVVARVEQAI